MRELFEKYGPASFTRHMGELDSALSLLSDPGEDAATLDEFAASGIRSAEQIRDEWIVGFRMTLRRGIDGTRSLERWTVVDADGESVEIEFAQLDAAGAVAGEPNVQRMTWNDLRNHASFPAYKSEREEATRETELGRLDGWIYTVREDDEGTTSEFFFARELPGAPVRMQTIRGSTVVVELEQLERFRPSS